MKTSELTGAALDWAVAKADNQDRYITFDYNLTHPLIISRIQSYGPSFIWSQGGPIIERECIDVAFTEDGWYANMFDRMKDGTPGYTESTFKCGGDGPTPLIAAMRCFVASKLGDEVDVPKELL